MVERLVAFSGSVANFEDYVVVKEKLLFLLFDLKHHECIGKKKAVTSHSPSPRSYQGGDAISDATSVLKNVDKETQS